VDGKGVTAMDGVIDYLLTAKRPGDKITLTVLRDGAQRDIQVTLANGRATRRTRVHVETARRAVSTLVWVRSRGRATAPGWPV